MPALPGRPDDGQKLRNDDGEPDLANDSQPPQPIHSLKLT